MADIVVEEIFNANAEAIFQQFAAEDGAIWFDSASFNQQFGRYSFIAVSPFLTITSKNGVVLVDGNKTNFTPFAALKYYLQQYSLPPLPNLPPFQGGAAGVFSYDLCAQLEKIKLPIIDYGYDDMAVGFYDVIVAFDHVLAKAWIISCGFPEVDASKRQKKATQRAKWMLEKIAATPVLEEISTTAVAATEIYSNFDELSYCFAVERVQEYIIAGDIFEANISQRFMAQLPQQLTPWQLYRRLRQKNAAPFAGFANFNNKFVVSASPERFLKVNERQIETRPIKGTRARHSDKTIDQKIAIELANSVKDNAENIMIVDLMRNDLSKVAAAATVKTSQICAVESYATVHHLVSAITATLDEKFDLVDLLQATFPGGSITGAPKVRAMEIIAEIETNKRGAYCGSLAYLGFNQNMDSSILIRSFAINNNQAVFQAGGAITLDSDAVSEYQETLAKAKALLQTLILNE